ncbi:UDP-N-acetylmuramoyl-tripeptide--D-alanyl-D-alanine ligase [Clostridiales Family XIII bacterium PM5-7]
MDKITVREINEAVNGTLISETEEQWITGISTDSRTAEYGDLFVPIIGEVHDAHKFIPQVVERGCRAFLISHKDEKTVPKDSTVILVDDTTKALQDLSKWYLKKLNLKTVAVTGSVGKTSTRDMVYYVLQEKYAMGKSEGNFNNDIGVPLTIFTFDQTMEAAVLEIGMDRFGEIHRLVDIIRPDIGVITNVGISHIEYLGSREGILTAKMEIVDYFGKDNTLIVNGSNDMLAQADFDGSYHVISVGEEATHPYYVHHVQDFGEEGIEYILTASGRDYSVKLDIPGGHNAINSALALAVGETMGVTLEEGIRGLSKIQLTGMRLAVKESGGIKVIDDTYNAAPDSMKSAINTLLNAKGKRKIAILSGMNELGPDWKEYHREVGRFAAETALDLLLTVGDKGEQISLGYKEINDGPQVIHFDEKSELFQWMTGQFTSGDVILVKGSRTMEMEEVVDRIINEQE